MLPATAHLRYECYPSAFQAIEYPLFILNEEVNHADQRAFNHRDAGYIKRLAPIGAVTYPLILMATPFTIAIDIVIGVAEAIFAGYKGYGSSDIVLILQKKWVAAPLQQLTFLAANVPLFALFTAEVIFSTPLPLTSRKLWVFIGVYFTVTHAVLGVFIYRAVQNFVGTKLPPWARPDGFNIFLNGGGVDMFGHKLTDEKIDAEYQSYTRNKTTHPNPHFDPRSAPGQRYSPAEKAWKDALEDARTKLKQLVLSSLPSPLYYFCQEFLLHDISKEKILGADFLNKIQLTPKSHPTDADYVYYHRQCMKLIHPDGYAANENDRQVAEILSSVLNAARLRFDVEAGKKSAEWQEDSSWKKA